MQSISRKSCLAVLALALAITIPLANAGDHDRGPFRVRFWPMTSFQTAGAYADLDGDGRIDCVSVDGAGGLHVVRQIGQGRFGAEIVTVIGGSPTTLALGDMNGDGKLDAVVGNTNRTDVLLGDGLGGFAAPLSYLQGPDRVGGMVLADFDHDGKLDAALSGYPGFSGPTGFYVHRGNGAGGFLSTVFVSTTSFGWAFYLAVGDLNGDGQLDLVGSLQGDLIAAALGNGAGGFSPATSANSPIFGAGPIVLGDVTGDGKPDALRATFNKIVLSPGNGAGGFGPPINLPVFGDGIALSLLDLDGDGDLDIVSCASGGGARLETLINNGLGSFTALPLVLCGGRPVSFAMVDADGDGLRDALITHQSSGIELLRGTPTGYDLSPTIATSGPLLLADMNSDGRLDLVSRQVNFQRIEVRLGDGVGGFGSASVTSIPNDAFALASGQFTADLRPDVVALTREGVVLLMVGDGAGGFGVMHQFSSGLVGLPANGAIAVGDVNGDGLADVVVTDANHAVAGILLGNGIGGLGAPTLLPVGQVPVGVTLADVNADGMQDILTANFNGSSVSVLRNLGGGAFASTTLATTGSCNNVEVADANADGKLDVLAATSTGLRLFVGDGLGGFAAPVQLTSVSTGAVVQSDFDGDGLQDLLSVDSSEGLLDLLPGQTGGSFAALRTYLGDGNFGGTQLLSFDANLDGRPDVLTNAGPPTLNLNLGSSIDPVTYCTAKLNSLGCLPALAWTGNPSASALNGFLVSSSNVRNNKPGILLYGIAGRSATAFSGGRLCVHAPVKRSPIIQSGGSVSGNDCTGVYALDLNAFAAGQLGGNPLAALQVAGTCVTCEFWERDQGFAPPNNATLSNALEYTVGI